MSPFEIDRILRTALAHHQAGRLAPAEGLYRQILAHSPNHDGALHWLGVLALQCNHPDLALDFLSRACALQPDIAAYRGNLGNAYLALGKLDEAAACFVRLIEQNPNFAEAHNTFGNVLLRQGKRTEAVAHFRRALELKPDSAEAHNNLGNAYQSLARLEEAEACYRRSLQRKPDHAEALNNLGNVLMARGKIEEAIACYRQTLERKPGIVETHHSLGAAHLDLGQWDEASACFRRALALNPGYAAAHASLGKSLQSLGKLDDAIACYRRAVDLSPGRSEWHTQLGNGLSHRGHFTEAAACYSRALEIDPSNGEAHNNLGIVRKAQGQLDDAIACYRRAIAIQPEAAAAHNNLGNTLKDQGQLEEAVDCYRRALALKPDYAEAHRNLGNALKDQQKLDEAEGHLNDAVRLRPDDDEAYLSRAMLWLLRGDFERGWAEYEWRWKTKKFAVQRRLLPQPQWQGEPLDGRSILLHAEQGLGDTLHFIRYVRAVVHAGGNVIVECQPQLKRLLGSSLGAIPIVDYDEPLPPVDVHCPLLSLPAACRTTMATIPGQVPYIQVDAEVLTDWGRRFAADRDFLKVGLAWAGNKQQPNDHNRSMALANLAPLAQLAHIRFYSLQKGDAARQTSEPLAGMQLVDWTDELADFADTAALIAHLDLVISVDTSISHLAGAMGKPTWTLLSHAACWRYLLDRDDSPWYPTMRLFRQPTPGDWSSVIERVKKEASTFSKDREMKSQ